jgi:hypothetical protein
MYFVYILTIYIVIILIFHKYISVQSRNIMYIFILLIIYLSFNKIKYEGLTTTPGPITTEITTTYTTPYSTTQQPSNAAPITTPYSTTQQPSNAAPITTHYSTTYGSMYQNITSKPEFIYEYDAPPHDPIYNDDLIPEYSEYKHFYDYVSA